jgi:hypothetical protein
MEKGMPQRITHVQLWYVVNNHTKATAFATTDSGLRCALLFRDRDLAQRLIASNKSWRRYDPVQLKDVAELLAFLDAVAKSGCTHVGIDPGEKTALFTIDDFRKSYTFGPHGDL